MYAVIPAAGSSSRMGGAARGQSKVLLPLSDGTTILQRTINNLVASEVIQGIVVAGRVEDRESIEHHLSMECGTLPWAFVEGGANRQQSVLNGLRYLQDKTDFVAVHDAARPFCNPRLIRNVCSIAQSSGAAILAQRVTSTVKVASGFDIERTIPRDQLWLAQTPQVFRLSTLLMASLVAEKEDYIGTDECELIERTGGTVAVVEGDSLNIKVTTPEDLRFAEILIQTVFKAEATE